MGCTANKPERGRQSVLLVLVLTALLVPPLVLGDGMIGNPPVSSPQQAVTTDSTIVEVEQASSASVAWDTLLYAAWTALTVL